MEGCMARLRAFRCFCVPLNNPIGGVSHGQVWSLRTILCLASCAFLLWLLIAAAGRADGVSFSGPTGNWRSTTHSFMIHGIGIRDGNGAGGRSRRRPRDFRKYGWDSRLDPIITWISPDQGERTAGTNSRLSSHLVFRSPPRKRDCRPSRSDLPAKRLATQKA